MTVCAVRLKSMPGTERLLLEYAQRGLARGLLAVEGGDGNGSGNIAGYLESDGGGGGENNAMIVRHDTIIGSSASGITGGELTIFGAPSNGGGGNNVNYGATVNNNINGSNIMGMNNVNAPFSGHPYSHSDADRPTHVADCKYIDALLQMPCYLNLNAFGLFTSSRDVSVSLAALEAVRVYGTLGEGYFIPHDCDGMPVIKGDERGGKKSKRNNNGPRVNPASTALLVLNEGPTPRTAILASQHYGWQTFAIDPSLSEEWDGYHNDIPNFTGYSGSISDFMDSADGEGMIEFDESIIDHLVIIGISHQKDSLRLKNEGHVNEIRSRYKDVPTTLVSMSPIRKATLAPQAAQRTNGRGLQECGSKLESDVGYEPNCSYLDEGVFSDCRQVEVWNFHNAEDDDDDDSEDDYDSGEDSQEQYEEEGRDYNQGGRGGGGDNYQKEKNTKRPQFQKKKNREREEKEEHNSLSFDEQLQSLSGNNSDTNRRRANKQKKASKKKNNEWLEKRVAQNNNKKKSEWLEERVAQFKSENQQDGDDGTYGKEEEEYQQEGEQEGMMSSLSTLSTKGAFDGKSSMDNIDDGNGRNEKQEKRRSSQDIANHPNDDHRDERERDHEENEVAVWSPPDEEVANQVWEKALAKHGVQESLCDQFENFNYNGEDGDPGNDNDGGNGGDHQEEHEDTNQEEHDHHAPKENHPQDPENDGLPPNWEAIRDPSSGDYYYNNWETGEVTWDRPGEEGNQKVQQDQELPPISPLEDGGIEDNHDRHDDYSEGSRSTTQSFEEKPASAPPLVQSAGKIYKDQKLDDITASDNDADSNYVFDDMSDTSSGIAALTSWNTTNDPSNLKQSNSTNGSPEAEDDMMFWSDNEEEEEEVGDVVGKTMRRQSSTSSSKRQPWHKKDSAGSAGIGNNDSFIYD